MNKITKNDLEILKLLYKDNLQEIIKKINNDYPVQYLIGYVDFFGYKINVNENVLIPRFETEWLVEKTIKLIKQYNLTTSKLIDLGTGSGCIAITLKKVIPTLDVTALEKYPESIKVSKENALNNSADITFIEGDIDNYPLDNFDIIISNPPYISYDEIIMPSVLKYEPKQALYSENNGLHFYESIINNLNPINKYLIAFEIGYTQQLKITEIIHNRFPKSKVICEKDLQNKDRYIFALINFE